MSIAEKLATISENVAKVYEAGKAAGGGGDSYYDTFWDAYQDSGNRVNYDYAFGGIGWTDDSLKPKYLIVLSGVSYNVFHNSKVSYIDESIVDCSKATHIQYFLSNNQSEKPITAIMDIASCTRMTNSFIYSRNLETVELKNIREDCEFQNTFLSCDLVNFRCTGTIGRNLEVSSPLLSKESIMNIFAALKDYAESGSTYTLTLGATNLAKLTDAEKLIATQKGWTLA